MIELLRIRKARLEAQLELLNEVIRELGVTVWPKEETASKNDAHVAERIVRTKKGKQNAKSNGALAREAILEISGDFTAPEATAALAKKGIKVAGIHSLLKTMLQNGRVTKDEKRYLVAADKTGNARYEDRKKALGIEIKPKENAYD
ncbi:MAG TPA: hypothetical protein VHZ30_02010 [Verrucomicrobiae bacterium]|jgi:hypothetical protein|nr:hypothetical protein [Verrucomicrobiae bacterium]